MAKLTDEDKQRIRADFRTAVNMSAAKLAGWLDTEESKSVGQKERGGEATGHASGRRIVALLGAKSGDLGDDDYEHMRKVVGYVARHRAQRPDGEVERTPWRYSLMNWGHDPLK